MKKDIWIMVPVLALAGCVSTPAPPVPDEAMAATSRVKLETLAKGHEVYMSECTRCHEAWMPANISSEDWHVVVPGMAWNANISATDEEALLAYIMAARKAAP